MKVTLANNNLLKEFNSADKQEIISAGDDFTISYEIEMESIARIDGNGDFLDSKSIPRTKEQLVEFFDAESIIRDQIKETEADEQFYEQIFSDAVSDYNVPNLLMAVIGSYKTSLLLLKGLSGALRDVPVRDSDIESFALSSFLLSDRGREYKIELEEMAEKEFDKVIDTLIFFNLRSDSNSTLQTTADDRVEEREQLIRYFLGMTGNDWKVSFIAEDAEYSPFDLFCRLLNIKDSKIIEIEIKLLNEAVKYSFRGNYPTFGDLRRSKTRTFEVYTVNGVTKEIVTPYAQVSGCRSLKVAIQDLAEWALDGIAQKYEQAVNDFDPAAYGFDVNLLNNSKMSGSALEHFLPNFWKKYKSQMDAVTDGSLKHEHNIEIKMKSFMLGASTALEYLDIFFDDFNKQKNFYFSKSTGLHTNLSLNQKSKRFNLLKALFFLSESEGKQGQVPFAYKGIESRYTDRHWSQTMKDNALRYVKKQINTNTDWKEELSALYKKNEFYQISGWLSDMIYKFASNLYVKGHGFNLQYTQSRGYIEFRYPGHDVSKEALQNLTLYYCHVVKASLDPEYKKKEYLQKLIGFVQDLLAVESVNKVDAFTALKKQYDVWLTSVCKANFETGRDDPTIMKDLGIKVRGQLDIDPYDFWVKDVTIQELMEKYPDIHSGLNSFYTAHLPMVLKNLIDSKFPGEEKFKYAGLILKFIEDLAMWTPSSAINEILSEGEKRKLKKYLTTISGVLQKYLTYYYQEKRPKETVTESRIKVRLIK